MRIGWIVALALTATSTASFGQAPSQQPLPDYELSRLPVDERRHPGYEPIGYRAGGVFFYPRLLTSARFDSNVYATPTDHRSDWALILSPQLTVKYGRWAPGAVQGNPSRFSYQLDLNADIYRFRELTREDRVNAKANLRTSWDIAHDLQFNTRFEAARKHEEHGDPAAPRNAAEPVPYNDIRGEATLIKTLGRFGVALNASIRNLTYENVESFSGTVLDQGFRDGTIYTTYVKPFYEFSPGYRAFVRGQANWRDYAGTGPRNRDSDGYEIFGGLDFLITPLIYGTVEVGYLSQTYDNPLIRPVDGLAYNAEITWLATALITARFSAGRRVAETLSFDSTSRLETTFAAQLDYELLRNVILSGGFKYLRDDYEGTGREDDIKRYSAGIDYQMNRHLRLGARYDFVTRDSTVPINDYDKHVVMFNVTAQY